MRPFDILPALVLVFSAAFLHSIQGENPGAAVPSQEDLKFVELATQIPGLVVDLPYATENNFFKKRFYAANRCFLRHGVAQRLARVQGDLSRLGLGLKIWDGYRPRRVQWEFWKVMPDTRYVADPKEGSRHNRGAAVDVTLVELKSGKELPMPTGFDDFSPKAASDFKLLPPEVLKNRTTLHEAMKKQGFSPLPTEWWHFDAPGWNHYPLEDRDLLMEQL